MGSGQPSHEGFREERNWAFRVSDPTSALCGGAVSAPFQGVGQVTAEGGTHGHPLCSLCMQSCPSLGSVVQQTVPSTAMLEAPGLAGAGGSEQDGHYLSQIFLDFISIFSLPAKRIMVSCTCFACSLLPCG